MKRIICIEDDPDIAAVIELALGDLYSLKIVEDTNGLMDILLFFKPDLILIDNYIGPVQAADVMREIKTSAALQNIPFILCSGHVDIKTIAHEIAASAYLEKPFDLSALYTVIEQVLQKHSAVT